jgi:hypothetical protein
MQSFPTSSLYFPSVQIFSSAPCSQILSDYVPPLMSETKFHTHTEPQAILCFVHFTFYTFRQKMKRYKALKQVVPSISCIKSLLNFFQNQILIIIVISIYLKFATFQKYLLVIFTTMLWLCPSFWMRQQYILHFFFAFTSRPTYLIASITVSVFFCMASMFFCDMFTST